MAESKDGPTEVVLDVDINATVVVSVEEWAEAVDDESGTGIESFFETNLDLTYLFGEAWICSIDRVEEMERR
jgi:hypothetical protein